LGNPVRQVSFKLDRCVAREARLIGLFRPALSFGIRGVSAFPAEWYLAATNQPHIPGGIPPPRG